MDINVTGVWEHNVTGQGVTVVVVDDGVQHTHQDIQSNYVSLKEKRLHSQKRWGRHVQSRNMM